MQQRLAARTLMFQAAITTLMVALLGCANVVDTEAGGQGKVKSGPLTSDDHFRGPDFQIDGLRYADFTHAGVPGGIPDLSHASVFDARKFSGSDREQVQAAVNAAAKAGGGLVYLPEGVYRFDDSVMVETDGIVIRGDGPDKTKIIFEKSTHNQHNYGAFTFHGGGAAPVYHKVVEPVERGDRLLVLDKDYGYQPGDFVLLRVHHDQGVKPFGFYNNKYALYREGNIDNYVHQMIVEVTSVDGRQLTLAQPLRLRFAGTSARVTNGKLMTHVRPIRLIRNCGVESLSIETRKFAETMYTSSVAFITAHRCWVRNVHTTRTGSLPIQFRDSKNVEIRDCVFDGAWNIGGGGNGYLVFWTVTDGLMANVNATNLRHAPNLQAWSNGCVVQGGTFRNNDVQWHTRWTAENLMEGVTMISDEKDDAYYGLFSTELYTTIPGHEPHLHGNVFYAGNIELRRSGPRGAVLGGLYKDWVFAYNRIVNTNDKPVVELGDWCDGVVFRGNHFGMRNYTGRPNEYGVDFKPGFNTDTKRYGTDPANNKNVIFVDNTFYGLPAARMFRTRYFKPTVNTNSVAKPDAEHIPAPKPYVPSLFEYQKTLKAARPEVRIVSHRDGQAINAGQSIAVEVAAPKSEHYGKADRIAFFYDGRMVGQSEAGDRVRHRFTAPKNDGHRYGRLVIEVSYGSATFTDRRLLRVE